MRPSKNKHLLPCLSPTMNTTRVLDFEYVNVICKQSCQPSTKSAMVMLFHVVIYNGADMIIFGLESRQVDI